MNIKISLDNTGDHPLYNFQLLSTDGKYRIEQSLRFAACREFHQEFMVPNEVKLEACFPATKKRSSLGIKLSEDALISRTKTLNTVRIIEFPLCIIACIDNNITCLICYVLSFSPLFFPLFPPLPCYILYCLQYMSEVLDRFTEWSTPVQSAFVTLLSATSVPLAYFKGEVDISDSESGNKDSLLTMDMTTVKAAPQRSVSNNVIVSHTVRELEEIRIAQLQTQMDIQFSLITTGDHPMYKMQLSSKDSLYKVEQTMRFASYRDFQQHIMDKCSLKMKSEFPGTKTRSSLGLKLTEEELEERMSKLSKVCIWWNDGHVY